MFHIVTVLRNKFERSVLSNGIQFVQRLYLVSFLLFFWTEDGVA